MKFVLALAIFFHISIYTFGQDYTKTQTIEGLTSLKNDIKTYNPALEDYNPNFDIQADKIIAGLDKEYYTTIEHFRLISQMCAIGNEGHFALGSWSDTPHKGFKENLYLYLPLSVEILEGRIYIWNDFSNENQLKQGDEILSINGRSSQEIINQLVKYTESDGDALGYTYSLIQSGFNWRYYLYIETPEVFSINYRNVTSDSTNTVKIEAITNKALLDNYHSKFPSKEKPLESISNVYELSIEGETSVLKLKSFSRSKIEKYDLRSDKLYKEIFQSISDAGVSTLVVDLRNNNGGRKEFANDMVPYILQTDNNDPFLRKSVSWNGKEKILKIPKRSSTSFKGKVIVLINSQTFSAASSLARFLREYANAIVVGQESGTRYEGFAAGSKQYVTIPYSDIEIGIPRYQTIYPISQKQTTSNRGLIPDHVIKYTIKDLMEKNDLEMEYVKTRLLPKQ